ncbi:DUF2834 domain-containing protein [Salipiger marinus]|uniref:K+-transporting ATPase, A chain n=1 Tax=Salipiger marinus TaxID=555512 RepID=A0A1G8I8Q7_9RHOB|nr:DUF2834 domain-containing protein [Salipiger marinus]SDI15263.1 Protein of unknown function [Salipiger marinus]
MIRLRHLWLALAVWGAVHPLWHLGGFLSGGGQLADLPGLWTANAAVTALSWDLMIAASVLSLWCLSEVAVRRNWSALLALPATWLVGVSFGLPLYLWLRSRPV